MEIELKRLIDEACRQFERNFSAKDASRLVNEYYEPDVLIVGDGIGRLQGHEGAVRYFEGAIAKYSACEMATREILPTSVGAIETGYVKLTPREGAVPTTLVYAVSWRRENSSMRAVLDYFAPAAT
jgi:ketosteroid isomerase-like protein